MKFMLDTNICIYLIKCRSEKIIEHLKKHTAGEVGISSITLAELRYGVAKSQHRKQNRIALESFVLPLEIASFDEKAAEMYGIIRSQLEKAGKPTGSLVTLIGAHALSVGVTLVTNNIREFKHIKSLKVVDWTA
ncbi:MAG: type II toxin-antitoxin system VapC family toxin [Candidatus Jettenia sp.]|uniref:Ribonuclease VapC n=1 Tax=Candidatus Jettenia caeni TaxID=247490 RepID=I3IKL4_9BACT|nr:type II toxin-antitoxin system VapC family toxin [Candidatus Jettenia sp. AMX1]MBC6929422.1 type II toxin-antitoxin system VapC family toxin [Candidatus Jettenia sp.]NUN22260.1 type II toxin-antitoxin system VapC family toxin [Candidatus Jettenia caeni]KAA0247576.1 MAG: type II toxin-antitoxin system VapC family toxin [Candidatus Jettenia sp. AMX1]MCE7880823.1 type II toxin-antitoxin system VapC family toxin [Candidatus Jettenia sp. AMX1]MCQ3927607.1 type II toxin-antitoxin system VapC fami